MNPQYFTKCFADRFVTAVNLAKILLANNSAYDSPHIRPKVMKKIVNLNISLNISPKDT